MENEKKPPRAWHAEAFVYGMIMRDDIRILPFFAVVAKLAETIVPSSDGSIGAVYSTVNTISRK